VTDILMPLWKLTQAMPSIVANRRKIRGMAQDGYGRGNVDGNLETTKAVAGSCRDVLLLWHLLHG
jgi:hypothetical protein